MSSNTYDAIVIGGGHNGLTSGAYFARHGARTVVLESRFAAVVTTDTWTEAVVRRQSLPRGNIVASYAAAISLTASS